MRAYLAVARSSFRRESTYRGATVAGVFTNTVFGFILASVLRAAFASHTRIGALDVASAVTFTFIAQGLLMVMGAFGEREVAERVRTGDIATDLYRPVSFSLWWGSMWVGRASFSLLARGIPPFVAGAIAFHLRLPVHPETWLWFLVAVALGSLVASRFWLLVNLGAFWLVEVRGLVSLAGMVLIVSSGFLVPLQFIGGALGTLCRASPFAALAQQPIEVFLEIRPAWRAWLPQLAWLAALEVALRGALGGATRKLVVQGG
jgi:ABC-2 type transport system permease protein